MLQMEGLSLVPRSFRDQFSFFKYYFAYQVWLFQIVSLLLVLHYDL